MHVVFVADLMLKKLARWLRILGFETIYAGDYAEDDDAIIRLAMKKSGAVLLTSDREMHAKAKDWVKTVLVEERDVASQLAGVIKASGLRRLKLGDFPSRTICPQCGSKLKQVSRNAVEGRVFPRVLKGHRVFWACANKECGKVYWMGTHWKKITKVAHAVEKKLARA
jgi:hypothetical protein